VRIKKKSSAGACRGDGLGETDISIAKGFDNQKGACRRRRRRHGSENPFISACKSVWTRPRRGRWRAAAETLWKSSRGKTREKWYRLLASVSTHIFHAEYFKMFRNNMISTAAAWLFSARPTRTPTRTPRFSPKNRRSRVEHGYPFHVPSRACRCNVKINNFGRVLHQRWRPDRMDTDGWTKRRRKDKTHKSETHSSGIHIQGFWFVDFTNKTLIYKQ